MLSHTFQLVAIVGFVCARAAPLGASASTLGKQVTTNYTATVCYLKLLRLIRQALTVT